LEVGDDVLSIDANRPIDEVVDDAARRLAR